MKITSTTYSQNGFNFILSDNGVSIPGKGDERLWFKNSKKSVVLKFRDALNQFCDEVLNDDEDILTTGCKESINK